MVYRLELETTGSKEVITRTPCDWNEAMIRRDEDYWISVAVGNSHCFWALGTGVQNNFIPEIFWKSTPVELSSDAMNNPLRTLSNHLPHQVHDKLFGKSSTYEDIGIDPHSAANVNLQTTLRRVSDVTVYVQSTNPQHERGILYLFSQLAHRMFALENTDFLSKEDGCYESLGVDRAASIYCAHQFFSTPVLLFDGGTAFTYTACDEMGKLIGGGISPGIETRFKALSKFCGNLPKIEFEEYNNMVHAMTNGEKETLPVFANDTKTGMITSVFQEISLHCHAIIAHFLKTLDKREASEEASSKKEQGGPGGAAREAPKVVLTGSDCRFLELLLEKPGLIVSDDYVQNLRDKVDFRVFKNACHYAVGKLLESHRDKIGQLSQDNEIRESLVGQRVAKRFPTSDIDGDFVFRGSVRTVKRGKNLDEDLFTVQYDDGDCEDLDVDEVYGECVMLPEKIAKSVKPGTYMLCLKLKGAMKLYVDVGEKAAAGIGAAQSEQWKETRKQSSQQCASVLLDKSKSIQKKRNKVDDDMSEEQAKEPVLQMEEKKASSEEILPRGKRPREDAPQGTSATLLKVAPAVKAKRGRPRKKPLLADLADFVGIAVAKNFAIEDEDGNLKDVMYVGKVVSFDQERVFWRILYEDGDEEEYDEHDLKKGAVFYIQSHGETIMANDKVRKILERYTPAV